RAASLRVRRECGGEGGSPSIRVPRSRERPRRDRHARRSPSAAGPPRRATAPRRRLPPRPAAPGAGRAAGRGGNAALPTSPPLGPSTRGRRSAPRPRPWRRRSRPPRSTRRARARGAARAGILDGPARGTSLATPGREMLARLSAWKKVVWETLSGWERHEAWTPSAALAFYTLFSLAPVLLVVISVAGAVFSADAVRGRIVHEFSGLMGEQQARAVQQILQAVADQPSAGLARALGIATLV